MDTKSTDSKSTLIVLKLFSVGAAIIGAILSFMAMNNSLSPSVDKNIVPIVIILVVVIITSRIASAVILKKYTSSN